MNNLVTDLARTEPTAPKIYAGICGDSRKYYGCILSIDGDVSNVHLFDSAGTAEIAQKCAEYKVKAFGYDPWGCIAAAILVQTQANIPAIEIRPSWRALNEACQLMVEKFPTSAGHMQTDAAGSMKPAQGSSNFVLATALAFAAMLQHEAKVTA